MLTRASRLAERVGSRLAVSRRGFLGWIAIRAIGATAAAGALWGGLGVGRADDGCPCSTKGNREHPRLIF
jgi:hypothetical protein